MENAAHKKRSAPRLSHKKSRMGCQRCKARKVKCDESRPVCGGCKRHGVACEYRNLPPDAEWLSQNQPVTSSASSISPPYAGFDSEALVESAERRLMELRLMHNYVAATCATFPAVDDPTLLETWAVHVPKMALEHGFLLKAIFALSALHLARTEAESVATEYANAHRLYLNAAVREQRMAVAALGQHNAEAVYFSAAMISGQVFPGSFNQDEHQPQYTPPFQWLSISAAFGALHRETQTWIMESPRIKSLVFARPHIFPLSSLFHPSNSEDFTELLNWAPPQDDTHVTETPPEDALAYQEMVSYTGTIWKSLADKESPTMIARRFMALGSILPDRFRDLVFVNDPRALIILAYIFAMTKHIDSLWWFKGCAEREVYGVRSILPGAWRDLMDWPVALLEADPITAPG